ncbi:MAG TPA: autotransporter-associated beta strand repeat-containing protein, partial [Candidatus Cybelea sp.]|nr:autotransporter-associated beta strand repeat-containing protein [Candidatus Cybelea sp.]
PGTVNVMTTPYNDTVLGGSLANFSGTIQVPADLTDTAEVDINSTTVNISSNATIDVTNGGTFFASGSGVVIAATNNISGPGNANNLGALRVDGGAVVSGRVNLLSNSAIGENTTGTISGAIGDGGAGYSITAVGSGTNTLYLLATNTYTGGTTISNGILSLGNGVINGTLPATPGSVTNYGTLQFDVPTNVIVTPTYNIQGTGMVSKLSDGMLWLTVSNSFSGGVTTGNGVGNGTSGGIIYLLNPYGFGNGFSSDLMETVSVQRTEVRLEGGYIMASNIYFQTSANSALTTAGSGYVVFHNLSGTNIIPNNVELVTGAGNSEYSSDGGLLVFDGTILLGATSARTAVFSGSGNGLVNGAITNGANALSIQKNGSGTWTFTGANLYSGTTTVSGGTLLVNGSTATNTVTVQTNGTLGGSGTIGGTVTLQATGIIQGGDGNLANTLTVPILNLGNTGTALTYSHFMISSGGTVNATTLNVSGTNIVQILDPSLTLGTNTLFTYTGSIGGSSGFAGFQLGSLPSGVAAQLLNTGSAVQLAVTSVTVVNTNPPVLGSSISGGILDLSWPADHKGWRLEVQTNSLSTGLSNNWFTWPNSTTETSVAIPVDPASPTVYFRMVYP